MLEPLRMFSVVVLARLKTQGLHYCISQSFTRQPILSSELKGLSPTALKPKTQKSSNALTHTPVEP